MQHTLSPTRETLHAHYFAGAHPALTVESGDTVSVSTPDVSWGLEAPTSTTAPRRKFEPRDPARDDGPCLCGPIAVRGAEPGDALEIEIQEVRTAPWGWTYAGRGMAAPEHNRALGLGEAPLTLVRWSLDRDRGLATSDDGVQIPLAPFPGTIGLAPRVMSGRASGWLPSAAGGNMDCRELTAGSTLWLPVMTDGGLLSVGDGHAAQGDGELSGTAIECPLEELRLKLTLRKGLHVRSPRARTAAGWVTLGFGATLDAAAAEAAAAMLDLMEGRLGTPRARALGLASATVSLRVTQMVNPLRGVHAVWSGA